MDKKNISCKIIEDLLPSYKDELLTDSVNDAVELHLNNCDYCRNKLHEIETEMAENDINSTKRDTAFISGIRRYKYYLIGLAIGAGVPLGLFLIFILWIVGLTFISN